jgi:hypothetical protein
MPNSNGRAHRYHAEATALVGHLQRPLSQEIKPQAYVKLPENGGYLSQRATDYRLECVLSFRSAYTQVAGNPDVKPGHGLTTLSTSVVEGLNVLDVVTADRVVAQISTEHPLDGYVPHVTFLGTRFENLRIAGHPVKLDIDLDMLGPKPGNDAAYSKAPGFMDRVAKQQTSVAAHPNLLEELVGRFTGHSSIAENPPAVECSLVNSADGAFPGRRFGHVIDVPNFGTIVLAALRLEHSEFKTGTGVPQMTTIRLNMIEIKMGCIGHGTLTVSSNITNGMPTGG